MSWISGVGLTAFGKLEGRDTLALMSEAASAALSDAGAERNEIDGLLCGYSMTMPHVMLATVFAEHFGLTPDYAHAVSVGGATGFAMVMLAHHLIGAGVVHRVLVVAGENRLTGATRDTAVQTLAQVGHPRYEVPLGPTVPAYYGLVASRYLHEYGLTQSDMAELAVTMREHAGSHPGAHLRTPITVDEVLRSKAIAAPLKLLDCCPVSDGAAACIVSREPISPHAVRIVGSAQKHTHQHVSAAPDLTHFGARASVEQAFAGSRHTLDEVAYAAIYDSFSVTLMILLEEIGLCARGTAGQCAREGYFDRAGRLPLNMHGGLLSYGHCGVAGAMAHLVEAQLQLTGRAGPRQAGAPALALAHADGGTLSSHVTLLLETAA
jgi:acetyl-CoA acetyltransferase